MVNNITDGLELDTAPPIDKKLLYSNIVLPEDPNNIVA
jgi:hypothetical protein